MASSSFASSRAFCLLLWGFRFMVQGFYTPLRTIIKSNIFDILLGFI